MKNELLTFVILGAVSASAAAHDGRRLEVLVVDGHLAVRGYNSAGTDDGGGVERPYYDALHDHWHFNPAPGVVAASADLPGFDLFAGGDLTGHDLTITLLGGSRWENPPTEPPVGTVPTLTPLGPEQEVFVTYGLDTVSTGMPGPLALASAIGAGGATDIDVTYDVADEPTGQIFVFEFVLSTDAPGVADSGVIHIMLSPDGANATEKLHHASLYTEMYFGVPVCPADLSKDGVLNLDDVNFFATAFVASDLAADVDGNGVLNLDDINVFADAFLGGCP